MSPSHKIYPRTLRHMTLKALFIAALTLGTAHSALADNPYWDQFGSEPVFIVQGGTQTLKFVNFRNGMLVAELDGGAGEISLPVSETMVQGLQLKLDIDSAKQIIAGGNFEAGLELLRPKVYPLIKFYQVPENFGQLHTPILGLLNTLIAAGEFEEISDLLKRIKLDQAPITYSQVAIRLMNHYIEQRDYDTATRISQTLPLDGTYQANISAVAKAADQLRAAGKYQAVIPIYREIKDIVPEEVRSNVEMWLAYSLVLAEELDEAKPLIEQMDEPAIDDQLFSMYKLLHGTLAHRKENYSEALDLLTRGFVRAQASYAWVPEMLYLIGECYKLQEDPEAARSVWTELTILYPDSPPALRGKTSLEQLPKPEPVAAN